MIVPAPPPALTCRLPGPWHISQPMSMDLFTVTLLLGPLPFTTSVLVLCSRACVAVRKSRTISSWQVAHCSEPTNSAPGMLGGAKIVLFVVLQESRMTASATVAPAPHKNFSRLPAIHLASREYHTNGEYCRKAKIVTTHFYGKKSPKAFFHSFDRWILGRAGDLRGGLHLQSAWRADRTQHNRGAAMGFSLRIAPALRRSQRRLLRPKCAAR